MPASEDSQILIDMDELIQGAFELDLESNFDMGFCIYRVPQCLVAEKPEAYIPQVISLGPYHHFRTDRLFVMEHYKLAAVQRILKAAVKRVPPEDQTFGSGDKLYTTFQSKIIDHLINENLTHSNACNGLLHSYPGLKYDKKLHPQIMAIDGLFLLDYLLNYKETPPKSTGENQPEYYSILRDVLKLENQIPMSVLKIILKTSSFSESECHQLQVKWPKFCGKVSPIKLDWNAMLPASGDEVLEQRRHLLDLLYHYITFTPEKGGGETLGEDGLATDPGGDVSINTRSISNCLTTISTNMKVVKSSTSAKSVFGFVTVLLDHIPLSLILESLKEKRILIPSVSELQRAGVKFKSHDGRGIQVVKFDEMKATFHLPVMSLTPASEVVIRNLVAYETTVYSKSSYFKRYIELMSSIIDTIEDVHILKEAGILIIQEGEDDQAPSNSQKAGRKSKCLSNAEIAEMFNGLTRTMESKHWVIDCAINKANKYYYNTWKMKFRRSLKRYIYSSWKFLTFLASFLLVVFMAFQTVCDIRGCRGLLR